MRRSVKYIVLLFVLALFIPGFLSSSQAPPFEPITIKKVSRFRENRIAFQHVDAFTDPLMDNSFELLLIIRDREMQLIGDGYDNPETVAERRLIYDMQRRLYEDEAMWVNKMNGKPDLLIVSDRRVPVMSSYKEEFVNEKFGSYYTSIRDKFVQRHADIFKQLMRHRKSSELWVERNPLPLEFHLDAPAKQEVKYSVIAKAKTTDGRIYTCEDADGDGITETFMVNLPDGFNWGYKSGTNIIFILNNRSDALKAIIGDLGNEAFYGTDEEMKELEESIPKEEEDILDWMEADLIHYEKFYE
ncbi:MAG: hypothetical protein PF637_06935 [Spirochaetes bacterium]|jgi:hypothetical protein|nr:hypothetical protein [Spirochaetota bacterium]